MPTWNFTSNILGSSPGDERALVALTRSGSRSEWTFAEVKEVSSRFAAALRQLGTEKGDVVLTLMGNSAEWVFTLTACWQIGAVAMPCNVQLTPHDLAMRIEQIRPKIAIVATEYAPVLAEAGFDGVVVEASDDRLGSGKPAADEPLDLLDPALVIFTSGTAGEAKPVRHGQRYLANQHIQAEHWFGARPGDLCWCTAASGWSKSSRNSFVAAWVRGAAALVHDGRFDPEERLDIVDREGVNVLCMAPTEYRAIAKRTELRPLPSLRHAVAAGEPLNAEIVELWRERAGVSIHDGYGQTETGALTGMPIGEPVRPGSMGKALPGFAMWIENGELVLDPSTIPTITIDAPPGTWHTGDRVRQDDDGYLWFEGRADDVIISAGYRIGPFEVESALVAHDAVAEAAAVAAPDEVRGAVVKAVVVLRPGYEPSDALAGELQEHVKAETAPYKYPRIVEFADSLPKTASGKIKRAELRERALAAG
ncbi:MAG TPA: AMP-binding protein [Thermoleophilaceae bacterium]|jgi:acyl-coenzyme A synthetase/AMP-(fatty) acid ligase|nr:AMP-binding protein [Thermoleophilaceae bacterium]